MPKKSNSLTFNFPDLQNSLSKLFPKSGKVLLTGGGKEFIERIGIEATRNAILSVLSGENLRTQTEPLSRRRIAQISGAVIAMFAQGFLTIPDFQKILSGLAIDQLRSSRDKENIWPAQWVLGLTNKLIQNVLRSRDDINSYVENFEKAINEAAQHCSEQIGNYEMTLSYTENGKAQNVTLNWQGMARLTTAIGAQTLAIRGSEKSMYGKLFERLILGSVLTLLGFKRVDKKSNKEIQGVFWLSDSSDTRESDATVIVSPGKIARFDIGFIGPGNSEISKDKLSRFANSLDDESGNSLSSTTFIVVDRLPETGKTLEAAKKIKAEIIQMSMQYWPRELSNRLKERFGFEHRIQTLSDSELHDYIKTGLAGIKVQEFLTGISVEQVSDDSTLTNNDEAEEE